MFYPILKFKQCFAEVNVCHLLACSCSLLLAIRLWLSNVLASQDDLEHPLHITQDLLVRLCCTSLEIGNYCRCLVDLRGQVLLCHGLTLVVLKVCSSLLDRVADFCADGLGLDDVVTSVDLGQVLTLCTAF